MSNPITVIHEGEALTLADTIDAPGRRWVVDLWQPGSEPTPVMIVLTVQHGFEHEAPVAHGPTIAAYGVVRRIPESALDRFHEAMRQRRARRIKPLSDF